MSEAMIADTATLPAGVPPALLHGEVKRTGMSYYGVLPGILSDLAACEVQGDTDKHLLHKNYWRPAQLVRAVVDSNLEGTERIDLINQVMRFALQAYNNSFDKELLEDIVAKAQGSDFCETHIESRFDQHAVWGTFDPFPHDAATQIRELTKRPLLILALGRTGLPSAITGALELRALGTPALMYPIKFSIYKTLNEQPVPGQQPLSLLEPTLRPEEHAFLLKAAGYRDIVVWDSDVKDGTTMGRALAYFRRVFPNRVFGVANLDYRTLKSAQIRPEWIDPRNMARAVVDITKQRLMRADAAALSPPPRARTPDSTVGVE
jgi:hypothetical protein